MPGASRWNRRISLCGADASSGAAKKSNSRTSSAGTWDGTDIGHRSEEHTPELQSLMRNSYAVLCLKTKHYHVIHFNTHIYTTLLTPTHINHTTKPLLHY